MRIINLEQGSDVWLARRRISVSASDASVLMGCHPSKKTWATLWKEKKEGFVAVENEAMKLGKTFEEDARHWFMAETRCSVVPAVVVHDEFPWLLASLDGLSLDNKAMVELKCPGEKNHKLIVSGKIPPYYIAQCQFQMLVTGLPIMAFVSYRGFSGHMIALEADPVYQAELLCKAKEFYEYLKGDIPPPDEKAYVNVDLDFEQTLVVEEWIAANEELKAATKHEKSLRDALCNFSDDGNTALCSNGKELVKLSRINREGTTDWARLCREHGISDSEIAKYRKPEIGYWKVSAVK